MVQSGETIPKEIENVNHCNIYRLKGAPAQSAQKHPIFPLLIINFTIIIKFILKSYIINSKL